MKSLFEVARNLNAIKEERAHPRIAIPNEAQVDENREMVAALLEGTGIDQDELAGIAMEIGASALNAVASVNGGIGGEELIAVIGSCWVDGVILGSRFVTAGERLTIYRCPRCGWHGMEGEECPDDHGDGKTYRNEPAHFVRLPDSAIRLSASQEPVDGPDGPEPSQGAGSASEERRAAQDDPRSERDA